MRLAAGVDLGTTSIEVLVVDLDNGKTVYSADLPNRRIRAEEKDSYLQDPGSIESAVRELLAGAPKGIASLSVTGQVHGILYTDALGNAVSPLYSWLDRRGSVAVDGEVPSRRLEERTGCRLPDGFGLLTHYAQSLREDVPRNAAAIVGIAEYITGALIGSPLTVTDASCLAPFGGWDLANRAHLPGVLEEVFSLRPVTFLSEAPAFSLAGETEQGIPVSIPTGDNQAGFLGSVAEPDRECLISMGTSGQVSVFSRESARMGSFEVRPFFDIGYLHVGATLCAGKAWETLQNFFCEVLSAFGRTPTPGEVYQWMVAVAQAAAGGSSHPEVVPTFSGTRDDPETTGSITGITLDNFTPGTLAWSTAGGIIGELYAYVAPWEQKLAHLKRIVATGNLVNRNPLFVPLLEAVFRREVVVRGSSNPAAMGTALYGAVAAGILSRDELVSRGIQKGGAR